MRGRRAKQWGTEHRSTMQHVEDHHLSKHRRHHHHQKEQPTGSREHLASRNSKTSAPTGSTATSTIATSYTGKGPTPTRRWQPPGREKEGGQSRTAREACRRHYCERSSGKN
uniref:Uncharacterized protein n=1 Tax=Arundo donax TaxID=35708 RepID=A0A0A9FNP6_ARUDO